MADGSVVIDTKLDLKGLERDTKQASSKILKLNNSISQTEQQIAKVTEEMRTLASTDIPTTEYDSMSRKIKVAEDNLISLLNQKEALEDSGALPGNKQLSSLTSQIEKAELKLQGLERTRDAMDVKSVAGADTEKYNKLALELDSLNAKLEVHKRQLSEAEAKENAVANGIKRIGVESKKGFASVISGSNASGKSLKEAANGVERLAKRFMNVLASVFVFTVLTKAFTTLRTSMGGALATNAEFSNSLAQIKSNLSTAFYPIYQAALPAINALMSALAQITGTIATFISMLFGTTVSNAQAGAKSLKAQAAGISGVGSAAKEAKKQLAGFDDAQILSKQEEPSGGGGGTSASTDVGNVEVNPKLLAWLEEMKTKLAPFIKAIKRLWKAFLPFAGNVFKGFIDFFASVLGSDLVVKIINALAKALEGVSPKTAQNIGKALGALATAILLYKAGSAVAVALTGLINLLKTLAGTTVGNILLSIAVAYVGFGAGNKIYEWITGQKIDLSIGQQISEILDTLFNDFDTFCEATGLMFNDLGTLILGLFGLEGVSWQEFKEAVGLMWQDFVTILGQIPQFFIDIDTGIKNAIMGIPGFFANIFQSAWTNIKNAFSNVKSFFSGIIQDIKSLFTNIGTSIATAVSDAFASGVNTIFSTIESIVNGFINKINSVIGVINDIPGVEISKLSTISLPRLATGTVVPANFGEFAAILGDNKREPEVVSPLSTMKQAVKEVLEEMGNKGPDNTTIVLTLDGDVVYRTVVKRNKRNTKLTGKNALAY